MDTKLTLNVDGDLVRKAKSYARDNQRSLSDLVENYFMALTHKIKINDQDITSRIKSLLGTFKVPEDFDYRKELAEELGKKYL